MSGALLLALFNEQHRHQAWWQGGLRIVLQDMSDASAQQAWLCQFVLVTSTVGVEGLVVGCYAGVHVSGAPRCCVAHNMH